MAIGALLGRLFGDAAVAAGPVAAEPPADPLAGGTETRAPRRAVPDPGTIIAAAVAQKVLHGWLQNRHQTRYPLVLNLTRHTAADSALIVEVIAFALQLGDSDPHAVPDAQAWVASIGGDPGVIEALAELRPDSVTILQRLQSAGLAPHGYAACARSLGRRTLANRRFLDYLSARLGIPDDVAKSINRRYAS